MKDYKRFTGTTDFNGEKCLFVFDNFKLTMEVSNFNNVNPFSNDKELPVDSLIGSIATEPNYAYFSFDKNYYSASFSSKGYSSFNVIIYVRFYIVLNRPFVSKGIKIQFRNNSFSKWLGVYPKYSNDNPFLVPNKICIKEDTLELVSKFSYKGLAYEAKPGYYINSSTVHYDFVPTLEIKCKNEMDYQSIYNLCDLFIKILRFFYYRYYVSLGDISLRYSVLVEEKTYYDEFGRFFFQYDEREIEPINLEKILDYGFMRWKDFYGYISNLVCLIENNSIYLFHLPEKRLERFRTDFASISTVSAAFECEFSGCFDKYKTAKKDDCNYIELRKKLLSLETTDDERSILKMILDGFFDNPSLQERAIFALDYFSTILESFKLDKKLDLTKVAKKFKYVRNKIDHGNLRFSIDNDTANTFYYLRIIVLCMQLTRMGCPKDELKEVIWPVLSLDCNR